MLVLAHVLARRLRAGRGGRRAGPCTLRAHPHPSREAGTGVIIHDHPCHIDRSSRSSRVATPAAQVLAAAFDPPLVVVPSVVVPSRL